MKIEIDIPDAELNRVLLAFGQTAGTGPISPEELVNATIDFWERLVKQMEREEAARQAIANTRPLNVSRKAIAK